MVLFTAKGNDIAGDKVRLTRSEAVKFQLNLVSTIAPEKCSVFIKYGPKISALAAGFSAAFIDDIYRRTFQVGNYRRFFTFVPFIIIPAHIHVFLQEKFVRDNIIIQKFSCPYCFHIRSCVFHLFFGAAFPVLTSAFTTAICARKMKIPGVPPLNHKGFLQFLIDKAKPLSKPFRLITVVQLLIGVGVPQAIAMQNNYFNQNIQTFITEYETRKNKTEEGVKDSKDM